MGALDHVGSEVLAQERAHLVAERVAPLAETEVHQAHLHRSEERVGEVQRAPPRVAERATATPWRAGRYSWMSYSSVNP